MIKAQSELIEQIQNYTPTDDAEKIEKERLINFLENSDNVYSRDNLTAHLTSSSWIVNKDKTKALLIHHNLYNCRAPLGGHADNNTDLLDVAIQEAKEESGIQNIKPINNEIIGVAAMLVKEHTKKGKIVPCHFHFDIRYLLEADENEKLVIAENEVSDVKWFDIKDIPSLDIDIMPIVQRVIKRVHNI